MSITKLPPNTIILSGGKVLVNDLLVSEAATPGHLAEMHDSSGANKWRKNSSATNVAPIAVFVNQDEMNKGVDDAYAAGDLAKVAFLEKGDTFWALIPSGQNIANADLLQSNGDGTLKEATSAAASAGVARFQALDNLGAITTLTRCRVQVI